jgi:hypothetical protein
MNSVSARFQSSQLLVNRNEATQQFTTRRKTRNARRGHNIVPPPTEELVNHLNQLGKQYPFCVNYKHKSHDPL